MKQDILMKLQIQQNMTIQDFKEQYQGNEKLFKALEDKLINRDFFDIQELYGNQVVHIQKRNLIVK